MWAGGLHVKDLTNALNRYYEIDRWGFEERQDNADRTGTPTIARLANATLRVGSTSSAVALGVNVGGDIYVNDSNGIERTHIGPNGVIYLSDSDGNTTVNLSANGTYGGQLQLFDPTGAHELAALGDQVGGGGVWLSNASGNPVAQLRAYYAANGYGLLQLFDGSSSTVRAQLDQSGLKFYNASGGVTSTYPAAPTATSVSSSYVSKLQFTRVGNVVTMVLIDPKSLVSNGLRDLGVVIPAGYRPYVYGSYLSYDVPGQIRVFVYPSGQIQIYNFTTNTGTMNVSMTVTWSAI